MMQKPTGFYAVSSVYKSDLQQKSLYILLAHLSHREWIL